MESRIESVIALVLTSAVLIFGLAILGSAHSNAFALHGLMMLVAAGFGVKLIVERIVADPSSSELAYHDEVIKWGILACLVWGVIGFFVGDWLAWQLAYPALNGDGFCRKVWLRDFLFTAFCLQGSSMRPQCRTV